MIIQNIEGYQQFLETLLNDREKLEFELCCEPHQTIQLEIAFWFLFIGDFYLFLHLLEFFLSKNLKLDFTSSF